MNREEEPARPFLGPEMGGRIVALLLVVEVLSVYLLWTLDPFTEEGRSSFAIYLAIDLAAFAMMSYIYRTLGQDQTISRALLLAGFTFMAALILVVFLI